MYQNILRTIRKKQRLLKTYTSTRDYQQYQAYKKVEQQVQNPVKSAQKETWKKTSQKCKEKS